MPGKKRVNPDDIVGLRVNHLLITKYLGIKTYGIRKYHSYETLCDCGVICTSLRQSLSGQKKRESCGCVNMKRHGERLRRDSYKHGKSFTSIHNRWCSMIARCCNPKNRKYPRYGGRGITVCKEWMDFKNFYRDMGEPPRPGLSLDRIDVNGNYDPSNCRWASQKTQQNNRVNNRRIEFNGENLLVTEWERKTGIPSKIIKQRIDRDRLSVSDALTLSTDRWSPTGRERSKARSKK